MVIIVEYPFFGKYVSTECLTYVCEFQFTYIYICVYQNIDY